MGLFYVFGWGLVCGHHKIGPCGVLLLYGSVLRMWVWFRYVPLSLPNYLRKVHKMDPYSYMGLRYKGMTHIAI